jgi:putative oxidoreductase
MGKIFSSSSDGLKDWGILLLRLMLGAVMFAHGASKVFGIWGGEGLDATVAMMAPKFGAFPAYLSIFTELLGGAAMILGVVTRFWGIGIFINMMVAVIGVHLANGFIGKGGFEFPLTLAVMALAIVVAGPGAISLDALLFKVPQKIAAMREATRRTNEPIAAGRA